ncbi:MAG: AAA domain-containing protein [Gammaproteobacteria bacterium]|nr:AAA domain-containing protein [Gammaproteobacteria bacterium]
MQNIIQGAKKLFDRITAAAGRGILGKETQVRLVLACLAARGHVLIEDRPGVGKTMLAHVLTRVLGLKFQRIQFTSDLLPADILGVSIYDNEAKQFKYHKGPIFAQMILADEVNRATPKTQSALLEAMEERQITVEGRTWPLPGPFFVLATQNPMHQIGTFPLPESQLDRFMMRIELGYPDSIAERALLKGRDRRALIAELPDIAQAGKIMALQKAVENVIVADALVDYLQAILDYSRRSPHYRAGLSPRAGLAIRRCAQSWALMHGRDYAAPEDVQAVLPAVAGHRLLTDTEQYAPQATIARLLEQVAIP